MSFMKNINIIYPIALILLYLTVVVHQNAYAQVAESDSLALVALYNSTNGNNWINNSNWLTNEPVHTWHGVTTICAEIDDSTGECIARDVVGLDLSYNGLTGHLPSELGNLVKIKSLTLGSGNFSNQIGGQIPPELGNLVNLEYLSLGMNNLDGQIPNELGNLIELRGLDLGYNYLDGLIPPELGNLVNLDYLSLDVNELSGQIPLVLGNLHNLKILRLGTNQLSGQIPSTIGNLTNLDQLYLDFNQLTGEIPSELGNLVNLTQLYLGENQLTGQIPLGLWNLVTLRHLMLEGNQLVGTIPLEIGNLISLERLDLETNNLSGQIPHEIGQLVNLQLLRFDHNNFSGQIPNEMVNLINLRYLNLVGNDLSGVLPLSVAQLCAFMPNCYLTGNNLCIPDTQPYRDIGVNPIGGLFLDPNCGEQKVYFYNTYAQFKDNPRLISKTPTNGDQLEPAKICADASTHITKIAFVANDVDITKIEFRIKQDPQRTNPAFYGSFEDLQAFPANDSVVVRYEHPRVVISNSVFAEMNLQIISSLTQEVLIDYPMQIYRAPITFVHGLWSNKDAFSDMEREFVTTRGLWPVVLTRRANYASTSDEKFAVNLPVVMNAINETIHNAISHNFSVGKINVVCHSMGGILTRLWIQDSRYNDNICRLITLNTPHFGSQMANLLRQFPDVLEELFDVFFRRNSSNGAVEDLKVDSDAILNYLNGAGNLNNNITPSHAIITTSTVTEATGWGGFLIDLLIGKFQLLNSVDSFTSQLFNEDLHDLIVAKESQVGGLQNISAISNQWHGGAPNNTSIKDTVLNLLNTDPENNLIFNQNGFQFKKLTYNFPTGISESMQYLSTTQDSGTIIITSPSNGIKVIAGTTIPISVSTTGDITKILFGAGNINLDIVSEFKDSPSPTFSYAVPLEAASPINIVTIGYSDSGFVDKDSITLNINISAELDSIKAYPENSYFLVGDIAHLSVEGFFNDGIVRDLSYHPDVKFESANNNIATFIGPGIIKGISEDTTIAFISFRGDTGEANVYILSPQIFVRIDDNHPEEESPKIHSFVLYQNYPNPFNPTTTIAFTLSHTEFVNLRIYNILGEEVATLVSEKLTAGSYTYDWDASELASGVYLYRIQAGDYVEVKKMVLMK